MGSRRFKYEATRRRLMGRVYPTLYYGQVRIVDYKKTSKMLIEFVNSGYQCLTSMTAISRGLVRDDTATKQNGSFIYGHGIIGNGKYLPKTHKEAYECWLRILERCYGPKQATRYPTYFECTISDDWYNFQHFASWFDRQIKYDGWDLDKDIIVNGNKVYGPEFCAFVPHRINTLLVSVNSRRGEEPIGVYKRIDGKKKNPYTATCRASGKTHHLGHYSTTEDAFKVYKNFKEEEIKRVSEEYRNQLDPRIFKALMNYEVEITD